NFDTPSMRPIDVTLRLAVGQQAVVVKNKLDQLDAEGVYLVEIFFRQTRHQQQGAGMYLDARRAKVVVALLGHHGDRQRGARVGRKRQTRQVQFTGGDQRSHAAVHVIGDPAQRILRRRVLTDRWM